MAIIVDYANFVLTVPRADMLLVQSSPSEVRQLDLAEFRNEVRNIEDDVLGMVFPKIVDYVAPKTVSGVTLAPVLEVLEPWSVTFEDGQYNVNIVNGNSNVSDRTNKNQVGVNTANSAGLQDLTSLEAASFDRQAVAIDVNSIYAGTAFPVGTRGFPVNNLDDAVLIAQRRGFSSFLILTSMTLNAGTNLTGYKFFADNPVSVLATIDPSSNTTNCIFENLSIQGTLDGGNIFQNCTMFNTNYVQGKIVDCIMEGTTVLVPASELLLLNCYSGVPGAATPVVDLAGTANFGVRSYSGGMRVIGGTAGGNISIDMEQGRVFIDASNSGVTFIIRGTGRVIDESNGANTIIDETTVTGLSTVNQGVKNASLLIPHTADYP